MRQQWREAAGETHRIRWYAYVGPGEKIPATSTMRGTWGWDAECSCGWESKTGGGTRRWVQDKIADHKLSSQAVKVAERFTFDVDWVKDHESLKAGRVVDGTSRVEVEADTLDEAYLLASQLVAARYVIPTDTRWVP